jgi:hypothetical protein
MAGWINKVKKFFQKIGNGIKKFFGGVVKVGKKIGETVAPVFKTVVNAVPPLKPFANFIDPVVNIYRTGDDLFNNSGKNLGKNIKRFIPGGT